MSKNYNALNKNIDCGPLDIDHISNMRYEFFDRKDYEWWGDVQEGDVVVDVGACVGFFTCMALDKGASKVYAIEPNKELLQYTVKNGFDYIINSIESPIVPVHAAIGSESKHASLVYDGGSDFPMMTFMEFIERYNIEKIDYLKIDCEGGEYNILTKENLPWIAANVKHIALEIHLRATPSGKTDFIKFRDEFLKYFKDNNKFELMNSNYSEGIWDNEAVFNDDWARCPAEFMMYIVNK